MAISEINGEGAQATLHRRLIVVPKDLLAETEVVQHLLLYFDELVTWPGLRRELTSDESDFIRAEAEFLASKGALARAEVEFMPMLSFVDDDGKPVDMTTSLFGDHEIRIPMDLLFWLKAERPSESLVDQGMRAFATQAPWAPHIGLPSVYAGPRHIAGADPNSIVVEAVLRSVPTPPKGLPWEDFLAIRQDGEMQMHLRRLRTWMQSIAKGGLSGGEIEDQLQSHLADYQKFMQLQHKKAGNGVLRVMLVTTAEVIAGLLTLRPNDALNALYELNSHSLALSEAELLAPGREVAYLAKLNESRLGQ